MEIQFQNTTTYTLEEYKKFVQFHNEKYNTRYHLYTLFILILLIFCMVLQFRYQNIVLGILFVFILGGFLFYRVFYPLFFIKKEASSKKITQKMTNTYTFYCNFVRITNGKDDIELKYRRFYKIFETKERFYLYLSKNYAYILDKNTFNIGNVHEFYSFMKRKLWIKF